MKYKGKEVSRQESQKRHIDYIKKNDLVFGTSDGNAFIGANCKTAAHSHAANYRPALEVYQLILETVEEFENAPIESVLKPQNKSKGRKSKANKNK